MSFDKVLKLAAKGDLNGVQNILGENSNFLNRASEGHSRTLLWEAVNGNRMELIEYLIGEGASVNIPGRYRSQTFVLLKPYSIAHKKRKEDLKDYLISKGHVMDIFSIAYSGTISEIESSVRKNKSLINKRQKEDKIWHVTPLHLALSGENELTFVRLLELGANVKEHSKLLYEIGCRRNRLDLIKLITTYGGDPTEVDVPSVCYNTNKEIIHYFMNKGLDADKLFGHGWPPIVYMCRGDKGEHPLKIKELIKYVKDINAQTPKGVSALHACSKAGYLSVLKILLNAGGQINIRDHSGRTALSYSRKYKRREVEKYLMENGGTE